MSIEESLYQSRVICFASLFPSIFSVCVSVSPSVSLDRILLAMCSPSCNFSDSNNQGEYVSAHESAIWDRREHMCSHKSLWR